MINIIEQCLLCGGEIEFFYRYKNKNTDYYKCNNCLSVMMDSSDYLSEEAEKNRYLTHNNDVEDKGYQEFVSPIVQAIKNEYNKQHIGLDFGAGTGPVITSLLEKDDYNVNLYDPYFYPNREKLLREYDYIICSEVMEHFYNPYEEFEKLFNLLKSNGTLFCMTSLYDENIDFHNWSYKDDETHVFFYHEKALKWIEREFGFNELSIDRKVIQFKKDS